MSDQPNAKPRDISNIDKSDTTPRSTRRGRKSASTLDGAFAGSVDREWRTWQNLPYEVATVLEQHGYTPSQPFVTGANPPRVRKQGPRVFQRASAWAVGRTNIVTFEASRGLEHLGSTKYKPCTPWKLAVQSSTFSETPRRRAGVVPVDFDPASMPGEILRAGIEELDILDVLPTPIQRQIIDTVPNPEIAEEYLFQGRLKDFPRDHEAGLLRVGSGVMIAVLAKRSILIKKHKTSDDAARELAGTAWRVETLTARLNDKDVLELECGSENSDLSTR